MMHDALLVLWDCTQAQHVSFHCFAKDVMFMHIIRYKFLPDL